MNLTEIEVLFSGYVFVITECPEKLFVELKSVPKLSKLLGETTDDEGREFVPLSDKEQEFMENILNPADYVVHRSMNRAELIRRKVRWSIMWTILSKWITVIEEF